MSLGSLGFMLRDLGEASEALDILEEAIWTLEGPFPALPDRFTHWMEVLAQGYRDPARTADLPVDEHLLSLTEAVLRNS